MNRRIRWVIGLLLIGSGIRFWTSPIWKNAIASSTSEYVIEQMEFQEESELDSSYDFKTVSPLSVSDVLQAQSVS